MRICVIVEYFKRGLWGPYHPYMHCSLLHGMNFPLLCYWSTRQTLYKSLITLEEMLQWVIHHFKTQPRMRHAGTIWGGCEGHHRRGTLPSATNSSTLRANWSSPPPTSSDASVHSRTLVHGVTIFPHNFRVPGAPSHKIQIGYWLWHNYSNESYLAQRPFTWKLQ